MYEHDFVKNARTNVVISATKLACDVALLESNDISGAPCRSLLSERHPMPTSPDPFEGETGCVGNRAVRVTPGIHPQTSAFSHSLCDRSGIVYTTVFLLLQFRLAPFLIEVHVSLSHSYYTKLRGIQTVFEPHSELQGVL